MFLFKIISILLLWNAVYAQDLINIDNTEIVTSESEEVHEEIELNELENSNKSNTDDNITLNEIINNWNSDDQIDEQSNTNNELGVWLTNIHFWFCDQGLEDRSSSLNAAIDQWKTTEFCMVFYNDAAEDITLNMDYVSMLDNTCTLDSSFEKFIVNIDQIKTLVIPAQEQVQTSLKINFPVWIEGVIWWCVAYTVAEKESPENDATPTWWGWIAIQPIFRTASHMTFFVWWIEDINNDISFSDIQANLDDNKDLNLNFVLSNDWNLEDKIEIKGTITNIFWYKKDFTIEWKWIQLTPGTSVPVSAVLWSLPSYGWLYNIEFTATATPFFSYDISNSSIDPTLLEAREFTASTTYFQMPWLIIIIVVIVILLIITIFRKPKEKVVYVQTPQQPTPNNGYNAYQQPQYQVPQQPQVAQPQPQYQQPTQPQYGQPTQDPNNYWQPNQQ